MADIESMDKSLKEIVKLMQDSNKQTSGHAGGSSPAPKTLREHFEQAFKKAANEGLGIKDMLGDKAGQLGSLAGKGYGAAGVVGAVGLPFAALATELAKVPAIMRDFTNSIFDANREFAKFSPSMAAVVAMSDMRDAFRKLKQGEELAPSAEKLSQARGNMEDQWAQFQTRHQRGMNVIGTWLADLLTPVLRKGNEVLDGQAPAAKQEAPESALHRDLKQLARDQERERAERMQPVHRPPADPRPDWLWDRKAGGDF